MTTAPSPSAPPHLGHAKSLDGIRGVAVLAVLGHNLDIGWLQGGFFGVDMFFALSGFLITTLLLEEAWPPGTLSLRAFFARRCLRLYPALIVLIAASALSSLTRPDVELARVGLVVASALLYFSNWVMVADSQAWVGGLGHTWSLAVEMHFYLLWAVGLALFVRRWGVRLKPLLALALAIAVASAGWRVVVWAGGEGASRAYAGTDTRFDAIFLGVAAALIRFIELGPLAAGAISRLGRPSVRTLEIFLAIGLGALIGRTPNLSPIAFLGGFGLVGGATALIILTTLLNPHSVLAAPLQSRTLVWFGRISYSLYLWHVPVKKLLPVERFSRVGLGPEWADVIRILLSVALAAASYYGIERVALRFRHRLPT